MRLLLVLVLFKLSLVVTGQPGLAWRVTWRDFLPSRCMRSSQYIDAWNCTASPEGGIEDTRYEANGDLEGLFYPATPVHGSGPMSEYCPFFEDMKAGTVSGHPDFEPTNACFGVGVSGVSLSEIVNKTVAISASGLAKPEYCTSNPEGRCGYSLSDSTKYTTSRKKYFDSWYEDDAKYNRRVAGRIELLPVGANHFSFDTNSFFPLNDFVGLADGSNSDATPIWPNSFSGNKYWFTTEIHEFFAYDGTQNITIIGDDDIYLYINGKLAVDLGGLHASTGFQLSLESMATELGLAKGNSYSFDLFHAERKLTGSNFKIDLINFNKVCNVLFDVGPITQTHPLGEGDIALPVGSTNTPNAFATGGSGFKVHFGFSLTGSVDLFLVEFYDDDENVSFSRVVFDFTNGKQEVSLLVEGEKVSVADVSRPFALNSLHNISLEYLGDELNLLELYIDGSLYLRSPTLSSIPPVFGIATSLDAIGGGNPIILKDFTVERLAPARVLNFTVSTTEITLSGGTFNIEAEFPITLQDMCENLVGGAKSMIKAIFVETIPDNLSAQDQATFKFSNNSNLPNVVSGVVSDISGNGTYVITFPVVDVGADWDLYLCVGDDCQINEISQVHPGGSFDAALRIRVFETVREFFKNTTKNAVRTIINCEGQFQHGQCDSNSFRVSEYQISVEAQNGGTGCPYPDGFQYNLTCGAEMGQGQCVAGALFEDCQPNGNRTGTYIILEDATNGPSVCPYPNATILNHECPCVQNCDVDCVGDWEYTDCVNGFRTGTYIVSVPQENGGSACPEVNGTITVESCAAVDCVGEFFYKDCVEGKREGVFQITTPALNGGKECDYVQGERVTFDCTNSSALKTVPVGFLAVVLTMIYAQVLLF